MNWSRPGSFSPGVDAFLSQLSPHGQPGGVRVFPQTVDRSLLRFQGSETVGQWFARCVRTMLSGDIASCCLEPELAVFACASWKPTDELTYLTIVVLKTECTIEDFYGLSDADLSSPEWQPFASPQYIRLDLDYGTLGPMGTHPLPHLHFGRHDAPRVPFHPGPSANVVVDFIEFIYRQFYYDEWLEWVEGNWKRFSDRQATRAVRTDLRVIHEAFRENRIAPLRELADEIRTLAEVLREARNLAYPLRMNAADRDLMSFPDWHG